MQAVALIHEEDGVFGVSFPDFPGVASGGSSAEEAIRRAQETLAVHVEMLSEERLPVPVSRTLNALRTDGALVADFAQAAAIALVSVELPGRDRRFNISMDERLMERIDVEARAAGETRSGYLAGAARMRLRSV